MSVCKETLFIHPPTHGKSNYLSVIHPPTHGKSNYLSVMAVAGKTELIRLQKSLGADEAIAKKLKVCRQAIQQLRQRYGIETRYATHPKRNKEILSLFKSGKTGIEIAKKFGISLSHAYRLIAEMRGKK